MMYPPTLDILIVEDDPGHAEAIRRSLQGAGTAMEIRVVDSLGHFREAVAVKQPDLVLLDLLLPDGRSDEDVVEGEFSEN